MRRRANGEGSVYRAGDGWRATLLVGGRRRYFRGRTRQEVLDKIVVARRQRDAGVGLPLGRLTFASFAEEWLATVATSVRPRTLVRYRELIQGHAMPMLGRKLLADVTAADLQRLYQARLATGLSPTTVHHLHVVLHTALEQAVRTDLVVRNVARLATPPRVVSTEMRYFTTEQAQGFLDAVAGERLEALYVLALTTGLRRGELLGLHWTAVDLDRSVLGVTGTAQRVAGGMTVADPKSARSRRQVICSRLAIDALRRHRASQAAERLVAGQAWIDRDLVFTNAMGGFLDGENLLKREFYPLLARAGLPRIRFHDLRHTAATLLLAQGVHPRIAADILGHASPALVMERYSHATQAMHRQAAQAMDGLLRPGHPPGASPAPVEVRQRTAPAAGVAASAAASGPDVQENPQPTRGLEPLTCGLRNRCSTN